MMLAQSLMGQRHVFQWINLRDDGMKRSAFKKACQTTHKVGIGIGIVVKQRIARRRCRLGAQVLATMIDELSSIPSTFRLPQEAQIFSEG
jgi:hypothetical protein